MRTDETIKSDVVDQLYWDSRIDASDVTVRVDNGNVIVSGTVPTYTAKQAAEDNAWLVDGVTTVDNRLDVEKPATVSVPGDDDIQANVERTLLWNPDLSTYDVDVSVSNGWVTLEGTVNAYWEKVQAGNDAQDVRGVIGVTNKLAVVPTERITDEQIAQDVIDALDRNMNVNVNNVDVTVENGRVILTGSVATNTAKTAAYNSARYTTGVTDVTDNLTVRPLVTA